MDVLPIKSQPLSLSPLSLLEMSFACQQLESKGGREREREKMTERDSLTPSLTRNETNEEPTRDSAPTVEEEEDQHFFFFLDASIAVTFGSFSRASLDCLETKD